jgi:hypothetical protein
MPSLGNYVRYNLRGCKSDLSGPRLIAFAVLKFAFRPVAVDETVVEGTLSTFAWKE